MSLGMMILTVVAVLVFCGLLQRVLDRMYLTDRAALLLIAAMVVGSLLPNVTLGPVSVNIGGALIPLGVCAYLFIRADEALERWRTLLGSVLTGAAVYGLSILLPAEAEALPIEPMLLYGIAAGAIAWLLGRSRRGAFICGVVGVMIADITTAVVNWMQGIDQQLILGGAGLADAVVVSGVLAVLLCELVGETVERMVRKRQTVKGGNHR
ncbi:MAG: DUF1614 domain-containing protein [Clostridia bacterium]|nr:DUF1614 domain-containing protein [Clostridia bacterium]